MGSMGATIASPFGPPVPSVPLRAAPIVLVIAQLRFPVITGIDAGAGFLAPFQEAMRRDYGVLRKEKEFKIALRPWEGSGASEDRTAWQFEDQASAWRLRLSNDSVALSAPVYTNRADFLARLSRLLEAMATHLHPSVCDRLGIRFVSRVADPELLGRLPELIEPMALGAIAALLGDNGGVLQHALADVATSHEDQSTLRARWGLLPANGTLDVTIEPVNTQSLAIDIDVATATPLDYSPVAILDTAREFCDRQYRFFRWIVQDQFLREFGGEL